MHQEREAEGGLGASDLPHVHDRGRSDPLRCPTFQHKVESWKDEQREERGHDEPPATTVATPRCTSLPIPVASAAGSMPTVATDAVIKTGRSRSPAPISTASNRGTPRSRT